MTKTSIYRLFFFFPVPISTMKHTPHLNTAFLGCNGGFFKTNWRILRKKTISLEVVNEVRYWLSYDCLDNIHIERMFLG